jgi:hypothetical protein
MKFRLNALYSLIVVLFLAKCDSATSHVNEDPKKNDEWLYKKISELITYVETKGAINNKSEFLNFIIQEDTVQIKNFMNKKNSDSLFLIPGNMSISYINKSLSLQLPGGYTPEGKSLVIFKEKNNFKTYVYISDDTLYFDLKTNAKLGYSITDSNMQIIKRSFKNGSFQLKITDK